MLEAYKTVYRGGQGEIVEKKSRFIATVRPVETEEEALGFIEEMKKKYWNASHNCFAYTTGERREIVRAGDDGEPSGTAGKPMLEVLLGAELYDTAIVVTRYFGGTLLGAGGLVRAYSAAAKAGLVASQVIEKILGVPLTLLTDYNGVGKIQYLLGQQRIPTLQADYTERVSLKIILPLQREERFRQELTEATSGRVQIQREDPVYYAELDGKVLLGGPYQHFSGAE